MKKTTKYFTIFALLIMVLSLGIGVAKWNIHYQKPIDTSINTGPTHGEGDGKIDLIDYYINVADDEKVADPYQYQMASGGGIVNGSVKYSYQYDPKWTQGPYLSKEGAQYNLQGSTKPSTVNNLTDTMFEESYRLNRVPFSAAKKTGGRHMIDKGFNSELVVEYDDENNVMTVTVNYTVAGRSTVYSNQLTLNYDGSTQSTTNETVIDDVGYSYFNAKYKGELSAYSLTFVFGKDKNFDIGKRSFGRFYTVPANTNDCWTTEKPKNAGIYTYKVKVKDTEANPCLIDGGEKTVDFAILPKTNDGTTSCTYESPSQTQMLSYRLADSLGNAETATVDGETVYFVTYNGATFDIQITASGTDNFTVGIHGNTSEVSNGQKEILRSGDTLKFADDSAVTLNHCNVAQAWSENPNFILTNPYRYYLILPAKFENVNVPDFTKTFKPNTETLDGIPYTIDQNELQATCTSINGQTATWSFSKNNASFSSSLTATNVADSGEYYYKIEADNHVPATGSFTVTINKFKVNVPGKDTTTFVYSASEQTYTPVAVNGHDIYYTVSENKRTDAGNQDVTVTLKKTDNYEWSASLPTYTFTIAPAPLSITAVDKSITYGYEAPAYTATYSGFVGGENKDVLTGTLTLACTYAKGNDAGTYPITPSGLSSTNYEITFDGGTLTVERKGLVRPTASVKTYTYNGSAQKFELSGFDSSTMGVSNDTRTDAGSQQVKISILNKTNYCWSDKSDSDFELTFTIEGKTISLNWSKTTLTYNGDPQKPTAEATGVIPGDTVTVTVEGAQTAAGNYTATASINNGNYVLDDSSTQSFTIEPKEITVVWNVGTYVYSGDPQGPTATATGLIGNDTLTLTVTGYGTDAGDHTAVVEAFTSGNYKLSENSETGYTIKKQPISGSFKFNKTEYVATHTGNPISVLTDGSVQLVNSDGSAIDTDSFKVEYSGDVSATEVGNYTLTATVSAASDNYSMTPVTINFAWSIKASVQSVEKVAEIKGDAPSTYAGTTFAAESFVDANDGYTVTFKLNGQVTTPRNAGDYTVVISLNDGYQWADGSTEDITLYFTIAKATLTVTPSADDIPYGGTPIFSRTITGFKGDDVINDVDIGNVSPVYETNYDKNTNGNVGEYTISITNNPYTAVNYNFNYVEGSFKVTALTVEAPESKIANGTSVQYSGTTYTAESFYVSSAYYTVKINGSDLTEFSAVGTYTITVELNANYAWSGNAPGEISFTITAKKIDKPAVTLDDDTKTWGTSSDAITYDGQDHTLAVNGNGEGYTVTYTKEQIGRTTGSYGVTVALVNGNYAWSDGSTSSLTYTYTIDEKEITVQWNVGTYVYNGNPQGPTATASGLVSGDTLTLTVTGIETNAGNHTATVAAFTEGNYKLSANSTQAYTINHKEITVQWTVGTYEYNGSPQGPTATATGLIGEDAIDLTVTGYGTNVGNHTATVKAFTNGNYTLLADSTKGYTISQKEITVQWNVGTYEYNGSPQGPTATASGLVGNDTLALTVTGYGTNAGSHTATVVAFADGNYKLTSNSTQSYTINKKSLTFENYNVNDKEYDSTTSATFKQTPTINGLVDGDDVSVAKISVEFTDPNALYYKAGSTSTLAQNKKIRITLELSGTSKDNYELVYELSSQAKITSKTITAPSVLTTSVTAVQSYSSFVTNFTSGIGFNGLIANDNNRNFTTNIRYMHNGIYYYGSNPGGLAAAPTTNVGGSTYEVYIYLTHTITDKDGVVTDDTDSKYFIANYVLENNESMILLKYQTIKIGDNYYTIEDALAQGGAITLPAGSTWFSKLSLSNNDGAEFANYNTNYNYSIASGSSVYVPWKAGTSYNADIKGKIETSGNYQFSLATGKVTSTSVYADLYIPEYMTLTVSGNLVIGAQIYSTQFYTGAGTVKEHGVIMNDGYIDVQSGATLEAYGYLKTSKQRTYNGDIDAYLTSGGHVKLNSGATAYDIMTIYDWPGGSNATSYYGIDGNGFLPFNAFNVHNISCPIEIISGATYAAKYALYMSDEWLTADISIVGDGGLFSLTSGRAVKAADYADADSDKTALNTIAGSNQLRGQKDVIIIDGTCDDNAISLQVKVVIDVPIQSSKEVAIPIPYMHIAVASGAMVTLNSSSFRFMPGSSVTIEEGGTLNVGNGISLYFYKYADCKTHDAKYGDISFTETDGGGGISCVDKEDAELIVNGTLNVSNGGVAGLIKTSKNTGKIILTGGNTGKIYFKHQTLTNWSEDSDTKPAQGYFADAFGNISGTAVDLSKTTYYSTGKAWYTSGTYTATFYGNGGTFANGTTSATSTGTNGAALTCPTPTRNGYSLTGWVDGAGNVYSLSDTLIYYGNVTLTAQWAANTYTVTFDANGGTVDSTNKDVTYDSTYGDLPTTTAPTGYTFAGWFTAETGGTKVASTTKVTTASNHTLYAQWTGITYQLTLDANGGTYTINSEAVSSKTVDVIFGNKYGSLEEPIYSGYDFIGWFTAATGGTEITAETTVLTASNHTIYARWEKVESQITINFVYGYDDKTEPRLAVPGREMTLPALTRNGYTFNGWYAEAEFTNLVTSPFVVPDTDTTLFAKWTANTYQIVYRYIDASGKEQTITSSEYLVENGSKLGSFYDLINVDTIKSGNEDRTISFYYKADSKSGWFIEDQEITTTTVLDYRYAANGSDYGVDGYVIVLEAKRLEKYTVTLSGTTINGTNTIYLAPDQSIGNPDNDRYYEEEGVNKLQYTFSKWVENSGNENSSGLTKVNADITIKPIYTSVLFYKVTLVIGSNGKSIKVTADYGNMLNSNNELITEYASAGAVWVKSGSTVTFNGEGKSSTGLITATAPTQTKPIDKVTTATISCSGRLFNWTAKIEFS